MALTFDGRSGRFRNERGQFVSERTVRAVIDDLADGASARMAALSQAMLDGNLSLAEWQAGCMRTIKQAHVASATIAHGGAARMTPVEYGRCGQAIKEQYQYLAQFAAQVASGEQPLTPMVVARAKQYGQACRPMFSREYGRDQMRRGYQAERNVLGAAEHCAQCQEQTARGWVPIGSLIPVGARTCRSNCRCSIRYQRDAAQAA